MIPPEPSDNFCRVIPVPGIEWLDSTVAVTVTSVPLYWSLFVWISCIVWQVIPCIKNTKKTAIKAFLDIYLSLFRTGSDCRIDLGRYCSIPPPKSLKRPKHNHREWAKPSARQKKLRLFSLFGVDADRTRFGLLAEQVPNQLDYNPIHRLGHFDAKERRQFLRASSTSYARESRVHIGVGRVVILLYINNISLPSSMANSILK